MNHRRLQPHPSRVLSVVERGWRGARECSLALAQRGIPVTHLIRGIVRPEFRAVIRPHAHVRLIDVPRACYAVVLWPSLIVGGVLRRIRWVLVDNERQLGRLQRWAGPLGMTTVLVREGSRGYDLVVGGRLVAIEDLWGCAA